MRLKCIHRWRLASSCSVAARSVVAMLPLPFASSAESLVEVDNIGLGCAQWKARLAAAWAGSSPG